MEQIIKLHFSNQGSNTYLKDLESLHSHFFAAFPDKYYHWKSHDITYLSENIFQVDDCTFIIMYCDIF